jgi:hypothetical protein
MKTARSIVGAAGLAVLLLLVCWLQADGPAPARTAAASGAPVAPVTASAPAAAALLTEAPVRSQAPDASFRLRLDVIAPDGAITIRAPRAEIRDPAGDGTRELLSGEGLTVARSPSRTVAAICTIDGWQLTTSQFDPAAVEGPELSIVALPHSILRLDAIDWTTQAPIPGFAATLLTEEAMGQAPMMQTAWKGKAARDQSTVILAGLWPAVRRIRVFAQEATRNCDTDWLPCPAGPDANVVLRLQEEAQQRTSLRVEVVTTANGAAIPEARVLVTPRHYEAGYQLQPMRHWFDTGSGLQPMFGGADAERMPEAPIAMTDTAGIARFEVRADRELWVVASAIGHAATFEQIAAMPAQQANAVRIALHTESTVRGTVRWDRTDPTLAPYTGIDSIQLRSDRVTRVAKLVDDGRFAFEQLAAGDYIAAVTAIAKPDAAGVRQHVDVDLRPLSLAAAEQRELLIEVGSMAKGATIVGSIVGMSLDADWEWTVVHINAKDASGPPAGRAVVEPRGNFQLAGLPEGEHLVLALGRTKLGHELALLRRDVEVQPGVLHVAVELGSTAPPIWIDRRPGATGSRRLRCELAGVDAWWQLMASRLPPLMVGPTARGALHGFGTGRLSLIDDQGRTEIDLPATTPILID